MDVSRQSNHIFVNGRAYTRMYIRGMEKQKRVAISLKLPPRLLTAVDEYRARQVYRPTRTQVIEEALKAVVVDDRKDQK